MPLLRVLATATLALSAWLAPSRAQIETVIIDSSTNIVFGGYKTVSGTLVYQIADDQVLQFQYDLTAAANSTVGFLYPSATNSHIIIAPSTPGGNGRLLIENVTLTQGEAAFSLIPNGGVGTVIEVTNATFRNNHSSQTSGVIRVNPANVQVLLRNVLFEGNSAAVDSGVIRARAVSSTNLLVITGGTFTDNYALRNFGALDISGTVLLTDVLFSNNRAGAAGGALAQNAGNFLTELELTDVIFKDNWAGTLGGALWGPMGTGKTMTIRMTGSNGITRYEYTGNHAGGLAAATSASDVQSGVLSSPASASAGGFYWASTTGTLVFDIASGVSLAIGADTGPQAGGAHDSIAGNSASRYMVKTGSGALVLNADNSYWPGRFDINQGALVLGNDAAKLGGSVNVNNGGILAGTGILTTSTISSSALNIATGGIVQVGDLAAAATPQTLTLNGSLTLADNAIIRLDLFNGNLSDRFIVNGGITQSSGTSIIDINALLPGSYNLGNATALATLARVTISGIEQSPGARQTAALSVAGTDLILTAGADISRVLSWTATSGTWNTGANNWAGTNSVTQFAVGDRVLFSPAVSTTITFAGTAPYAVADITVDSASELLFTGTAGINADPSSVYSGDGTDPDRITDATGKLVKDGAGTLIFANTGNNSFKGGIELAAGTLAFNDAAQLDTTGTNLRVTGDATLRADAAIASLSNAIAIDSGKTLTLDTQVHAVTHTGAISSAGTLVKTGAGTLTLAGNSATFTGATQINAGALTLDNATLGGSLSLAPGVTLTGAGAIGGAVNAGVGSLIDTGLSSSASGTLAIGGVLTLNGGILNFDLFGQQGESYVSDQITAAGLALTSGTVTIGAFQSGTYTLGVITGLSSVANLATDLTLAINTPGRQSAALSTDGDKLLLVTMADISRTLTWNGFGAWEVPAAWDGSKDQFASGDRVIFDATAPAPARAVTLTGMNYVSDIFVTEDGYTFAGTGGITSGTRYISNTGAPEFGDIPSGKLTKTGDGTLTFANTGGNRFEDGIDIGGGMIAFSNPNQLATGSNAAINFLGTGTLRSTGTTITGVLNTGIAIADGKTAVLDMQGSGTLTMTGALTGGPSATFTPTGSAATLMLTGNSAGYTGATAISGAVLLDQGALGGSVNVATGATFGGHGKAPGIVNAMGGATVRIGLTGTNASEELRVGSLNLGSGATVTGHGVWSGGATISGITASANVAAGKTIFLDADVSGDGDLVKNGGGILEVTNGRLLNKRVLVETGTLGISGAGIAVERLAILPNGVLKGVGVVTVTGAGGLENVGQIRVGRAGGGSIFGTLEIAGDYTGAGGSIHLAIGDGQAKKDTINFIGAISGSSIITVTPTEGITTADGLPRDLITRNGAVNGIDASLFSIHYTGTGGTPANGIVVIESGWLYNYDPASGMWGSTNDPIPLVPPALGMHAASLLAGKAVLDSLDRRLDVMRREYAPAGPREFQIWAQGIYRHDKLTEGIYKNAVNEITGAQAGVDLTRQLGSGGSTGASIGLFAELTNSDMNRMKNSGASDLKATGGGLYAQLAGPRWHVNATLRAARHDYTLTLPGEPEFTTQGAIWSGAVGAGVMLIDGSGWNLEPRVRLAIQSGKIDDATDSRGMTYRVDGIRSLEMRAGLGLWRQWQYRAKRFITPHIRLDIVHDTKGAGAVSVAGSRFESDIGSAGFEAGVGLSVQLSRALSASVHASWSDNSNVESHAFNLGLSHVW